MSRSRKGYGLNARDTKTLRRLINEYGHADVLGAIADYYDAQAAMEYYDDPPTMRRSDVSKRYLSRAAKVFRRARWGLTHGIDGNIESQPEFDDISTIG